MCHEANIRCMKVILNFPHTAFTVLLVGANDKIRITITAVTNSLRLQKVSIELTFWPFNMHFSPTKLVLFLLVGGADLPIKNKTCDLSSSDLSSSFKIQFINLTSIFSSSWLKNHFIGCRLGTKTLTIACRSLWVSWRQDRERGLFLYLDQLKQEILQENIWQILLQILILVNDLQGSQIDAWRELFTVLWHSKRVKLPTINLQLAQSLIVKIF